jgi:predicted transcriptional regulator
MSSPKLRTAYRLLHSGRYSVAQAADALGISRQAIYQYFHRHGWEIPASARRIELAELRKAS